MRIENEISEFYEVVKRLKEDNFLFLGYHGRGSSNG